MVPFKTGMVVVGQDFCGRQEEIRKLKAEIKRCSRVCLLGERRIGKTSLVHETVRRLRGTSLVFIDFLGVKSPDGAVRRVIDGIFASATESLLPRLMKTFSVLRPVIGIDPFTNAPTLSLAPGTKPGMETLEEALETLGKLKRTVVFLDEFQSLLDLPREERDDLISRMRSRIQLHAASPYIFAGSVRNDMDRMFFDPASPFYKSAIRFELGPLTRTEFSRFLADSFGASRRTLSDDLLEEIFDLCHDVPGDVQRLCQCLWDETEPGDSLDSAALTRALRRLFSNEERSYTILLEYVSAQQLKCLRALADRRGSSSLNGDFSALTGIAAESSVRRAVNSLVKKRILFQQGTQYRFCDPFFGAWIRYKRL